MPSLAPPPPARTLCNTMYSCIYYLLSLLLSDFWLRWLFPHLSQYVNVNTKPRRASSFTLTKKTQQQHQGVAGRRSVVIMASPSSQCHYILYKIHLCFTNAWLENIFLSFSLSLHLIMWNCASKDSSSIQIILCIKETRPVCWKICIFIAPDSWLLNSLTFAVLWPELACHKCRSRWFSRS